MMDVQWIMAIVSVVVVTATISILYYLKKRKEGLIELNCKFCLSENTDELLDTYKRETGVSVDGILGNDFMVEHGYIIDYEKMLVKHKSVKISIKDAMDIVEIPLVVLYQGWSKYIFMLDTGAQDSIIHSKYLNDGLNIDKSEDIEFDICGIGGSGTTTKRINTKLYYGNKRQGK